MEYRIAIIGSRDFYNFDFLDKKVKELMPKGNYEFIIVSGGTKCSDIRYENEIEMMKSLSGTAKVVIEFCDYHSERYNAESTHESEAMAIKMLKNGYKDGDLIYGSR